MNIQILNVGSYPKLLIFNSECQSANLDRFLIYIAIKM